MGERTEARGQTTFDFVIGIGIFIAAVGFTLTFLPSLLAPFDSGGAEEPATVDRVADRLVGSGLGEGGELGAIDWRCVVSLVEGLQSPVGCGYDGGTVSERVGFGPGQTGNVSITVGGEIVCWESRGSGVEGAVREDCGNTDIQLAVGPSPESQGQETVTARRAVRLYGQIVTVRVTIW